MLKGIPKFLKRRSFDHMLYGYCDAIVTEFQSVSLIEAVKMFARRHQLSPEEFNIESAHKAVTRMRAELKEYTREQNKV